MNQLKVFENPAFGQVRIVSIDGEPWFVGKDVATALGYEKPTDAVRKHVDEEDRGISKMETPSGTQQMTIINESGLYSLILSSKLPTAREFKRWVTSEVLPSLRKAGSYQMPTMTAEQRIAAALIDATKLLDDYKERNQLLAAENSKLIVDKMIMQPKADYFDELVDRNLLTNFTEAAKQIGVKRKDLIAFMVDHGYLYRDKKGNLLPYANKKAEGLFDVKQSSNRKTGWCGCQTMLTPKGLETFRLLSQGM